MVVRTSFGSFKSVLVEQAHRRVSIVFSDNDTPKIQVKMAVEEWVSIRVNERALKERMVKAIHKAAENEKHSVEIL